MARLGPFDLLSLIGKGGMGQVYLGRHRSQAVDIAAKIVNTTRGEHGSLIATLENEVHAMARLNHPGILRIYDTFTVPRIAASESFGALLEGSPVVVMEYATHGSLERFSKKVNWGTLRAVLFRVLDALGHAHARNTVHRDLKPSNVLLTKENGEFRVKLADFGLAHAFDTTREFDGTTSGTPRYMAPEQIEGRWRDQGPWTDLYAVGCLVYFLLNGAPPFSGSTDEILRAHLYFPLPDLETEHELPPGFFEWLKKMCSKSIEGRFKRAADAAYALWKLEPVFTRANGLHETWSDAWEDVGDDETLKPLDAKVPKTVFSEDVSLSADFTPTTFSFPIENIPRPTERAVSIPQPPLPKTWRREFPEPLNMKIVGAGLNLFGLRTLPLIGREQERDTLWNMLQEVSETNSPRFAVVTGEVGTGKSQLVQWISQRAHEVGAAVVLRAVHSETPDARHGLVPMLYNFYHCEGLDEDETRLRLRAILFQHTDPSSSDLYYIDALAGLLHGSSQMTNERFSIYAFVLGRLAQIRPVIIQCDDVNWGVETIEFVNFLAKRSPDRFPVLFLMTTRPTRFRTNVVRNFVPGTDVQNIVLDPLKPDAQKRLIHELLLLDDELSNEVMERTGGNPLFAIQLVGDWVARGVLEVGETGFKRSQEEAVIPDSIFTLLRGQVTGLISDTDPPDQEDLASALLVAAVLGRRVDRHEWQQICAALDISDPIRFMSPWVSKNLINLDERGFSFTHVMLHEAILRELAESSDSVHRACASNLETRPQDAESHVRVGDHWAACGEYENAANAYVDGAWQFEETSAFIRCKRLLEKLRELLTAHRIEESNPLWGDRLNVLARCALRQGDIDIAHDAIETGTRLCRTYGWEQLLPHFTLHTGSLARKRGDSARAFEMYNAALQLFTDGERSGIGRCLYGLGEVASYVGDLSDAAHYFERAVVLMEEHRDDYVGIALTGLASVHIRQNRFDIAESLLRRAIKIFESQANRSGRAATLNMLGELERSQGRFEAAEKIYLEVVSILTSIGSSTTSVPMMNVGLIRLTQKNYKAAKTMFSVGLEETRRTGETSHMLLIHLCLARCAAGLDFWDDFDLHLAAANRAFDVTGWIDLEIAENAEATLKLCLEAEQHDRAEQINVLAKAQRKVVG